MAASIVSPQESSKNTREKPISLVIRGLSRKDFVPRLCLRWQRPPAMRPKMNVEAEFMQNGSIMHSDPGISFRNPNDRQAFHGSREWDFARTRHRSEIKDTGFRFAFSALEEPVGFDPSRLARLSYS
jgi:hypothetical protein